MRKQQRKGFSCLRCNATFGFADKFIAHSLAHTQLQPFRCTECDQSFTRRDRLRKHMATQHATLQDLEVDNYAIKLDDSSDELDATWKTPRDSLADDL